MRKAVKTVSTVSKVLAGKYGPKPAIWTALAITCTSGAISVGTAVALGALPSLSAGFFAASLVIGGVSSAINAASSVSNHNHFATLTELQEKNLAMQQENLEIERKLLAILEAQQQKLQA
jgi:hypothetical protein